MKLFSSLRNKLLRFTKDESGASAIEYAVIAGLIIAAAATAIGALGTDVTNVFTSISDKLP
jgi:Flp pilus assembly protein, pilin Flp